MRDALLVDRPEQKRSVDDDHGLQCQERLGRLGHVRAWRLEEGLEYVDRLGNHEIDDQQLVFAAEEGCRTRRRRRVLACQTANQSSLKVDRMIVDSPQSQLSN